ncbi:Head-specific guanylate cyclase [Eumeta japonica]|uniref:guanylate cyclase n=1 Tax=Eumeta variegata TaxID=151549 RepID=A0A4C2AFZ7_EUMVA|nr:Head-specific guanylate cyclase [Eumeta japonica]
MEDENEEQSRSQYSNSNVEQNPPTPGQSDLERDTPTPGRSDVEKTYQRRVVLILKETYQRRVVLILKEARCDQIVQNPRRMRMKRHCEGLEIKGQMVFCPESDSLLFVGSPFLDGLEGLTSRGLFISDIPLHDATRDVILVGEQARAQDGLRRRMDKLKNSIEEASKAVDKEREKNVSLLHLIFPPHIAKRLWLGEKIEAKSHDEVTMLFSDIVGFTSICATATPMMVIAMLEDLYSVFDIFCEELDVYKVETIGDAYCVASGLHKKIATHAPQIAWMALRMVETCAQHLTHEVPTCLKTRCHALHPKSFDRYKYWVDRKRFGFKLAHDGGSLHRPPCSKRFQYSESRLEQSSLRSSFSVTIRCASVQVHSTDPIIRVIAQLCYTLEYVFVELKRLRASRMKNELAVRGEDQRSRCTSEPWIVTALLLAVWIATPNIKIKLVKMGFRDKKERMTVPALVYNFFLSEIIVNLN